MSTTIVTVPSRLIPHSPLHRRAGMTCTVVMKEGAAPQIGSPSKSHGGNFWNTFEL
jgi:hypothetical protein